MTLYTAIFYLLALLILAATALAITRRHPVHAVVYLIVAFLGTALLFYLLGAALLAAFEVVIYAGAIMVLFIFIIMMLQLEASKGPQRALWLRWAYGSLLGLISFVMAVALIHWSGVTRTGLKTAMAEPREFGEFLFQNHWLGVEIASFLLLVALVGALYLGRREGRSAGPSRREQG
jgi:NADH-quinone oxidoreductase subunit J